MITQLAAYQITHISKNTISKQQNLDANLNRNINAQMLFIIEEAKETIFPKGNIFKYNINIK